MLIRRGTGSPLACLGGTIMSPDTEFDPSEGLISPDYEKLDLQLPERAVYAFLSEADWKLYRDPRRKTDRPPAYDDEEYPDLDRQ